MFFYACFYYLLMGKGCGKPAGKGAGTGLGTTGSALEAELPSKGSG